VPPYPLRPRTLAAALMSVLVPAATAHAACPAPAPTAAKAVTSQIGELRARSGLPALKVRTPIVRPARAHSGRMARTGRLFHDDITRWGGRARAAQNVSMGDTATGAFMAMVRSHMHRRALLDPRFRSVGVGVARDCTGMLMVTVNLLGPVPRA
jgi:uncharacterized protein YkwD